MVCGNAVPDGEVRWGEGRAMCEGCASAATHSGRTTRTHEQAPWAGQATRPRPGTGQLRGVWPAAGIEPLTAHNRAHHQPHPTRKDRPHHEPTPADPCPTSSPHRSCTWCRSPAAPPPTPPTPHPGLPPKPARPPSVPDTRPPAAPPHLASTPRTWTPTRPRWWPSWDHRAVGTLGAPLSSGSSRLGRCRVKQPSAVSAVEDEGHQGRKGLRVAAPAR